VESDEELHRLASGVVEDTRALNSMSLLGWAAQVPQRRHGCLDGGVV
jgi:hypothetical protein